MREVLDPKRVPVFWSKVDRSGDCWLWTAARFQNGYGAFRNRGLQQKAHRIAYVLGGGTLENGQVVRHTCDVKACVRPDHLRAGSQRQNIADCWDRKRAAPRRKGESNESHKLTFREVEAIRAAYVPGKVRQSDLAEQYGVHQTLVSRIVRGVYRTTA